MTKRITLLLIVLTMLVVIPFLLWESYFTELSNSLLAMYEARGMIVTVIILLLALDVLLPVPSSFISIAGGAYLGFALGLTASLIGMTLGCVLGYSLGLWLHEDKVRRVVSADDQSRLHRFFGRQGARTLVIARPVPVFAEVSVIMAGVSGMPFSALLRHTVPANLGISAAYSAVGHYSMQVDSFLLAGAGAVAVPVGGYCVLQLARTVWPRFFLRHVER